MLTERISAAIFDFYVVRLPRVCLLLALSVAAAVVLVAAAFSGSAAAACPSGAASYDRGGKPGSGAANDPLFGEQFGLDQINAPQAWALGTRAEGVVIAVVDGGVDLRHPDLASKLISGTDLADDREACPGPQDQDGHGTHVAGIAAASTDNGIGVAGTAPKAQIMPIRVLDEEGSGSVETIVRGIDFAASHGADVINLSLGANSVVGQLPLSELDDAVQRASDRGAVVVAAAGNDSFPMCSRPASAASAVCVGATDRRGMPSFYSNLPNDDDAVGVRAPGGSGMTSFEEAVSGCDDAAGADAEDVWSTFSLGVGIDAMCAGVNPNGYETLAGTSMAAPFVSGVAALLVGAGLNGDEVRACLAKTSINPMSGARGSADPVYGFGIVDAEAAVRDCTPTQARSVSIARRSVRMSRRGLAGVRVSCRPTGPCRGILALRTTVSGSGRGRALGRRSFALPRSGRGTVRVRLRKTGRRLVRRERRVRVRASIRLDASPARARASFRLLAPRRR